MFYPSNFEQKIAFLSVRDILKRYCKFSLSKEEVDAMSFTTDFELLNIQLDQTSEMLAVLRDETLDFPTSNYYDVRESMKRIQVEGLILDEGELYDLRRTLDSLRGLCEFLHGLDEEVFPRLSQLVSTVNPLTFIVVEIDKILDKYGRVKDNATPELYRIRKQIVATQSTVSNALNSILRQAQKDGYVESDVMPTLRDGRLVIPISPMYKRKVPGIVHDESASGKTVFLEPQQVVNANNKVRELEREERREVKRILMQFTEYLRPYIEDVLSIQYFLGAVDFVHAKALFAQSIDAVRPQVVNARLVEWRNAVHPLLYLSLSAQGKQVVPLTIELNEEQRILLISGPNAGGKSVCLKTVALLQYMMQCGLLVNMHGESRMGIFNELFIDIGDEQSIENDLSTYSSHLLNMKYFMRNSTSSSLLLIDEFGGGTEPQIGGAIAESILNQLNENKAFGVITTHYTNLKHFAEDAEGIVNGAMLYDRHLMQPLFELAMGQPGSSFAIEIARKIGLPEKVITAAVDKVGADHTDYDKHLQDIVRDKRYWERKRQGVRQKEKQLEEMIQKYELRFGEIKQERRDILDGAKQEAQQLLKKTNATIENTIRKIKEAQAEKDVTKEARQSFKQFEEKLVTKEDVVPKKLRDKKQKQKQTPAKAKEIPEENTSKKTIEVGGDVRMKGQAMVGQIVELNGKNAVVVFGLLKSTVPTSKLEVVSKSQLKKDVRNAAIKPIRHTVSNVTENVRERKLTFKHDIDVRGMRGDEALQAVTYFIDDAVMVSAGTVRILHGTGTGYLRQMIRQYLNTVSGVSSFRDEHVQHGGAGITVVEL